MNTKIIKFDINKNLYNTLIAKQGDTKSRFLLFNLLDGSIPFSLENRSVRVYAVKPDRTEVFNDLIITDAAKGYCILELTTQMLAVAGTVKLELMVIEEDKKLTSSIFYMDVKASINSEKAVVSTNEFGALLTALSSLNEYDNYKKEIAAARDGEANLLTKVKKIDEQLDNKTQQLELSKATKQELEVERKRIDSFTSLPSGSTTGDAELIDGRIGADGVTYKNIGGAIRSQFNTILDINRNLMDIDLKGEKNIEGFVIGLVTGDGAISPSDNRISNANVLQYITPKEGDVFSLTDYTKYNFALGKNSDDVGWIYNDKGVAYWSSDLTLRASDVDKVHHILIKRTDNANVTDEDLNYINSNFFYNKNKIELKKKIIGIDQLKDEVFQNNKKTYHNSNIFHLSFDDVSLSLIDLYNNKDNYRSIFDNKFFNMLKVFHEKYGMVVSCYVYGDDVKFINDTFKKEFLDNSNWLKFGFHCKSGGEDYSLISNSVAKNHYDTCITNIYNMCGTALSIDRLPRLNYFKGSLENLKTFRDCDCGIIGCLSADDDRNTYYFNEDQIQYLRTHDVLNDYETGLIFLSTDLRLDWFVEGFSSQNDYDKPTTDVYNELVNRFKNKKYADMYNNLVVFGHEWQVYNSDNTLNEVYKGYIESSLKFAQDYNFDFDFPMNYMQQITPKKIITSNNAYYNLDRELEFVNGAINGDGIFVESNTRIIAKEVIFTNTKKVTIKIPSDCKINYMYQADNEKIVVGWSNDNSLTIKPNNDTIYNFVVAKQDDTVIVPEDILVECTVVTSL